MDSTREAEAAELERLSAWLATRESPLHLARAALAGVGSVIVSGVAAKLWWDQGRFSDFWPAVGALGGALALESVVRALWGRRVLRREREAVVRFRELRQRFGMGDPAGTLRP